MERRMTPFSSSIPNTLLDPDDCLRRLRARYPDLPIQRYMVFTNGWDSLALALDDTWLVRFARRPDVEAQLAVESRLLPALAPALPAPIPRFELIGDPTERGPTFAGYRLLPGVPLPVALAAALWEPFLADDANFAFHPALIHADLAGEHILCDPATGMLTGIIDWGDARVGDPALDFTGLLRDAGPAFADAALAAYPGPVDPAFRRRMEFYARLIPYHEVRFGLDTHQPDHLVRGLAAIRAGASAG
jgi:aminoglycoside phosphotransferase (APT) family kinase protein